VAAFNPEVQPTQDPNYIGWSKPIEQPQPNKALGSLLDSSGDIFDTAVNLADTSIKHNVEDQAHTAIDAESNQFTAALQGTARQLGLLGDKPASVPNAVSSGIDNINSLSQAKAAKNLPQIYYDGRIMSITKDLRSQYPGYRDYIDSKVSEITEKDPANPYRRALQQSINTSIEDAKSERNKIQTQLIDNLGQPGMFSVYQGYMSGKVDAMTAMAQVAKAKANTVNYENAVRQLTLSKLTREDQQDKAQTILSHQFAKDTGALFDNIQTGAGVNTPGAVQDQISTGKGGFDSDEQAQDAGAHFMQNKGQFMAGLLKKATDSGLLDKAGGIDKIAPMIENIGKIYDQQGKAYFDADYGAAHANKNYVVAATSDTGAALLKDPTVGLKLRIDQAIHPMLGDQAMGQLVGYGLNKSLPDEFQALMDRNGKTMLLSPSVRSQVYGEQYGPNMPVTLSQQLQHGEDNDAPKSFFKALLDFTPTFMKSKDIPDDAKKNILDNSFGSDSLNILSKVKPGQQRADVYTSLSTPAIVKEAHKAGGETWNNYKNWSEVSFAKHVFGPELDSLEGLSHDPSIKISFNQEKNEFSVAQNSTLSPAMQKMVRSAVGSRSTYGQASASIQRINQGIRSLSNVAREEGTDVPTYLLRSLADAGYTPTGTNLPSAILNALLASRRAPEGIP
jgi:hypothetical protein